MSSVRLHRAQSTILQSPARYITVVSGRRFGKTSLQIVKLLSKTLGSRVGTGIRPTVLALAPTHPQVRSVLFNPFLDFCAEVLGERFHRMAKINRTLMTVDFGAAFPILRFSGAHGASSERLRGLKLLHCSVDECKDVSHSFLTTVIFPALADLGGTALFTGTPSGRSNTLYKLFSETNPEFQSFNYSSYANTLLPGFVDSLNKLRQLLPPEEFESEILGKFTDAVGAFYVHYKPDGMFAKSDWGAPLAFLAAFDPGARNRGYLLVGQYNHHGQSKFRVEHAEIQSEVGLDSEVLDKVGQELYRLNSVEGQGRTKTLMIAVDPSRPDLVKELRRRGLPGIKAENSINAGLGLVNLLFYQGRLEIAPNSAITGKSQQWFSEQVEDYHRKTSPTGEIMDVEADDVPTHALDPLRYAFATLAKHTKDLTGTSSILPI